MDKEIKLIPKSKQSWVGRKYEDALLVGFCRNHGIILLTKIKGKKRAKSGSAWAVAYWKICK